MVLFLALVAAPVTLFAAAWKCACAPAYCTMACCRHGKCLMMMHEHARHSGPAVQCDCMRFPVSPMLAPLTEMMLASPAPMPALGREAAHSAAVALAILPGFLPFPFHPPRG